MRDKVHFLYDRGWGDVVPSKQRIEVPSPKKERVGFELVDALMLLTMGALVGGGLIHLIERGLFR